MNVALVHPSLAVKGGAENLIMWLGRGLASRGHRVTLFTPAWQPDLWKEFRDENVRIHVLTTPPLARMVRSKVINRSCYHAELAAALRGFDVVNAHNHPSHHWALGACARLDRSPPVVWYCNEPSRRLYLAETDRHFVAIEDQTRGDAARNQHLVEAVRRIRARNAGLLKRRKRERDRRWDRQEVARLDLILATSRFTRDNLTAIFGIEPPVCYPGIPGASVPLSPGADRREPGGRGATFLTVGATAPKKNLANVLEAVRILAGRSGRDRITLKVTGSPDAAQMARTFAEQHGIGDCVEPLGWLSDQALRRHYAGATALVYVPIDEPFGLMPVESMFEATPPIVSDHGGPAEVVAHEQTGLQVNPFDPEAIAGAMARLAADEALRRTLGEAGREAAHARFSLDRFLDRFEAEVAVLCGRGPQA